MALTLGKNALHHPISYPHIFLTPTTYMLYLPHKGRYDIISNKIIMRSNLYYQLKFRRYKNYIINFIKEYITLTK